MVGQVRRQMTLGLAVGLVITLLLGTVACVQRNATVQEASIVARMTHASTVDAVTFSPDRRYVVSGSGDRTARVWEAASGRKVARVTHGAEVSAVTFSPDGQYVVSGSGDDTVQVWEAVRGREVARMTHASTVFAVAFSPDRRLVVSGSYDTSIAR